MREMERIQNPEERRQVEKRHNEENNAFEEQNKQHEKALRGWQKHEKDMNSESPPPKSKQRPAGKKGKR